MSYYVGLDLGKTQDPSALVVVEKTERYDSGEIVDLDLAKKQSHYLISHAQRWPLGTSYVQVVEDVAKLLARPPLPGCRLAVDASGVGRPVVEHLYKARLPASITPILITAGHKVHWVKHEVHVAKRVLAHALQVVFQTQRLEIAKGLKEREQLIRELRNFSVKINPDTMQESFEALQSNQKDDLCVAASLAIWSAERPRHRGIRIHSLGRGPKFKLVVATGDDLKDLEIAERTLLINIIDPGAPEVLPAHQLTGLVDRHTVRCTNHDPNEHGATWDAPVEGFGRPVREIAMTEAEAKRLWNYLRRPRGTLATAYIIHSADESRALSTALAIADAAGTHDARNCICRLSDSDWTADPKLKPPNAWIHKTVKSAG